MITLNLVIGFADFQMICAEWFVVISAVVIVI